MAENPPDRNARSAPCRTRTLRGTGSAAAPIRLERDASATLPRLAAGAARWAEWTWNEDRLEAARTLTAGITIDLEKERIIRREEMNEIVLKMAEIEQGRCLKAGTHDDIITQGLNHIDDGELRRTSMARLHTIEAAYRAGGDGTPWSETPFAVAPVEAEILELAAKRAAQGVHSSVVDAWVHWCWIARVGTTPQSRTRLNTARFWIWGRIDEPVRNPVDRSQLARLSETEQRSTEQDIAPLARLLSENRGKGIDREERIRAALADESDTIRHRNGCVSKRNRNGRWRYRQHRRWDWATVDCVTAHIIWMQSKTWWPIKEAIGDWRDAQRRRRGKEAPRA